MVKTKAPLLSLSAGGQIGKVLTASNWKGRTYMKKLTVPTNPNTAAQVGVRQMLKYLSQNWSAPPTAKKATWTIPAAIDNITNLDAYIRANLKRWTTGLFPGEQYPIDESLNPPGHQLFTPTNLRRGLQINFKALFGQPPGAITLYRSLNPSFTPHYTNSLTTVRVSDNTSQIYIDSPLASGTYYYYTIACSVQGKEGTTTTRVDGTVP